MFKITLKAPIPDGLQPVMQVGETVVVPQYARTMQVLLVEGNAEQLEELLLRDNPLPMDDTWFKFTRGNGTDVFVPGNNIAFIDIVN